MASEIDFQKVSAYWKESADRDLRAMENLFLSGDYSWALFIGHLVLEKLLKSYVVKATRNHPPFTHDLTRLAELTSLEFSQDMLDSLDTITAFNISARYDNYKKSFYEKCTEDYTIFWINKIKEIQIWIKEKL